MTALMYRLVWHLDYNIYPPKGDLVSYASEAIRMAGSGQGDLPVPGIVDGDGNSITASDMVEDLRLEEFVADMAEQDA